MLIQEQEPSAIIIIIMDRINCLNNDIFHNILGRLPALSFAAAACVNKTWYHVCSQILSRPKLVSALSLNPSLRDAVAEVLDKVFSKPIRPDFAIACISEKHGLRLAHLLLTRKLGAKIPLVTHISNGVMGRDALTDEMKEAQWEYFDYSCPHPRESNVFGNANQGIVLIVGYLPGLKVEAVPFFHPKRDDDPDITMIDHSEFVKEIKAYTASVSNDDFPAAIMMFGDRNSDMNSIVAKMDHVMPKETAIVGDAGGCFLFNSLNYTITCDENSYILDAVALVFATDKDKSPGETQFHVVMAGSLIPFGPRLEVVAVGIKPSKKCSWLCAKIEGLDLILSMEGVLETIAETVHGQPPDLYLAVTQKRTYNSREGTRFTTSTAFYHVIGCEDDVIFFIDGVGVRPGDSFIFYHKDAETTNNTNGIAFDILYTLEENTNNKDGVFGALIFTCHSRGQSYFGQPNADMLPFVFNFPGVPVAGIFCNGEIGRGGSTSFIKEEEYQEQSPPHCSIHACSAVNLVMSYLPPPSMEH
ncbi:F-box/LRR-repeat protein At5g63520-like [Gastrolobium bilobum]|uniref:F-box/LRR-repeat protein At5g63520-like n=1 Tax=Gastrolobium bilobum TaxID=150636 RepID=UPI002AB1B7AB|nr:F-box/LRR-repeat protein At5g63520-like [Gastrolobium bilobum]